MDAKQVIAALGAFSFEMVLAGRTVREVAKGEGD